MTQQVTFDKFTDRARNVLQKSNQQALRLNHEYVGTEHILLGLIAEDGGVASSVFRSLDIDVRKVRLEVEKIVLAGPAKVTMGRLPRTPRANAVIKYSIEESSGLGHNYVGTEHLLLGLLREQESIAAQVLMNFGLSVEKVRAEIRNVLGGSLGQANQQTDQQACQQPEHKGRYTYKKIPLATSGIESIFPVCDTITGANLATCLYETDAKQVAFQMNLGLATPALRTAAELTLRWLREIGREEDSEFIGLLSDAVELAKAVTAGQTKELTAAIAAVTSLHSIARVIADLHTLANAAEHLSFPTAPTLRKLAGQLDEVHGKLWLHLVDGPDLSPELWEELSDEVWQQPVELLLPGCALTAETNQQQRETH